MARSSFIERHGLRTPRQAAKAKALAERVRKSGLRLVRLAWADPHGASRAKALSVPAFVSALSGGYNVNVATTTLDSAGARVFASFTRGGGMGLEEMTGSPNLTVIPDPDTFRVLPWAPDIGWALCDEYFNDGRPFHFSSRHLLRKQVERLAQAGMRLRVGLEVEWYLARVAEERLGEEHLGEPGLRGRAIAVAPPEPGYSYHSESNMDLMQPVLSALAAAYQALGLELRSIENEWGPGQIECTFAPGDAPKVADEMLLFRTATRQVCRRMGYLATFMARPALKGYYASGWHLHESLVAVRGGRNLLVPARGGAPLSPLGLRFVAGLLEHAAASTVFATPTVNGYRRFKPNSLAPDRAGWGVDHRGAMVRVTGSAGDGSTRVENRLGESASNPYLFIASQIVAGLDGIDRKLDPGPPDLDTYNAERAILPKSLPQALEALEKSALYREHFGGVFIDYYLRLKRSEAGRFARWLQQSGTEERPDTPTAWEQNEYFDFF
jgi:glutamine synthetase